MPPAAATDAATATATATALRDDPDRQGERAAVLNRLRHAVRAIERGSLGDRRTLPLGVPAIDAVLGGEGLPLACLHGFEGRAACGFAAALAGRLMDPAGVVVWCVPAGARARLYPPGLAALGLDPGRLMVVLCHRRAEMLAVMEDALRSGAAALVVAELAGDPEARASRRLQIACEAGDVTGVLLLTGNDHRRTAGASVAALHTRWRIEPAPSLPKGGGEGAGERTIAIRWRLALMRNRAGTTGCWDVSWDDKAHRFALAAEIGDR